MKQAKEQYLNDLHATLLDMLVDIDALCQRHGLRYSIYCGTLLGAVREGDFIPWDDDADLMMPIEDYRRFFRIAQRELSEKYAVQDLENTPQHPWLWMRMYRKGTTFMRKKLSTLKINHGIALDVYPMIGVAKTRFGYRAQRTILGLASALRSVDFWRVDGYPEQKRARLVGKALSLLPRRLRRILSMGLFRLACISPKRKTKCCTLDAAVFSPKYDVADWADYTKIDLAGKPFVAPTAYDKLLRVMYRDYMTPPPVSERTGHRKDFGGVTFDAHQDYTRYLEQDAEEQNDERKLRRP